MASRPKSLVSLLLTAFHGQLTVAFAYELNPMNEALTRRRFLSYGFSGLSTAWVSSHWPAILSAATHARSASQNSSAAKLDFFSSDEAREIDALTVRIIPTDDMPGAREAGALYFIDRALTTFAADDQKAYRSGLPDLQARTHEMFPAVEKFSTATPEQQDQILRSLDEHVQIGHSSSPLRPAQIFFEMIREHAIIAFLVDPESGGNRDAVGWKVIGREPEHMFRPPFGYYDKDYPGWQPNPPKSDDSKT
jgi:gluconate 2-dehydrogenase gamma chain